MSTGRTILHHVQDGKLPFVSVLVVLTVPDRSVLASVRDRMMDFSACSFPLAQFTGDLRSLFPVSFLTLIPQGWDGACGNEP